MGVASRPRVVPSSLLQARPSRLMVCSLIWLKGLNRCSSVVLPYMDQSAPSPAAVAGGNFLQPTTWMSREPATRSEMLKRIVQDGRRTSAIKCRYEFGVKKVYQWMGGI